MRVASEWRVALVVLVLQVVRVFTVPQVDCTFDDPNDPICGWTQNTDDDFDWTRHAGKTPTANTGPDGDHTTGSGYYLYIEKDDNTSGNKAVLTSPVIKGLDTGCFTYHISVKQTASTLVSLAMKVGGSITDLDTVLLNSGSPEYLRREVTVVNTGGAPLQFKFTGSILLSKDPKGDVAIDDISLTAGGPC